MRTEESEKDEQETQDVGITLTTFEIRKKAILIFINMDCSNGFYDGPKDTLTACIPVWDKHGFLWFRSSFRVGFFASLMIDGDE